LTNFHKIDIFQSTIINRQSSINNPKGGGEDISSLSGKRPGPEANSREI
jgi:hypothetical protein